MPKTLTQVSEDAAELSQSDRLKLARILLELSESDSKSSFEEQTWDDEIERRLLELRSGKVAGVPLEDVKRKIEKRWLS